MDERRQRMKERKIVYMLENIIQKVTVEVLLATNYTLQWQPISIVNNLNSFKSWGVCWLELGLNLWY